MILYSIKIFVFKQGYHLLTLVVTPKVKDFAVACFFAGKVVAGYQVPVFLFQSFICYNVLDEQHHNVHGFVEDIKVFEFDDLLV